MDLIYSIFQEKINAWRLKGAITPSSRYLVTKILSKIDFKETVEILQLGFGSGVFTKQLLQYINAESKLVVFEINNKYTASHDIAKDDRVVFIHDSAEYISEYYHTKKFDYILSTLPLATLPKLMSEVIFIEIRDHLKSKGSFFQFQYSLISRSDIKRIFNIKPRIDFTLFNIPPAFIYEVQNASSARRAVNAQQAKLLL